MELKEREKNILAILAVFLVCGIYWFWTKPVLDHEAQLKQEIATLKKDLRKPKFTEEDIGNLEQGIALLRKEIETLKYQIPKNEQRGFLIRDLENLAHENNIDLKSFIPKDAVAVAMGGQEISKRIQYQMRKKNKSVPTGKVLKTIIQIDSSGEFEDYRNFFEDILTYYRAVEISDITISKAADPNAAGGVVGVDTRFSKGRGASMQESLDNTTLNVSFTLNAFTALPDTSI